MLATLVATAAPSPTADAAGCAVEPGFAELRQQLGPDLVGGCPEPPRTAEGGDLVQPTTNGVFVWRKAAGSAAFSIGRETWASGPRGVQRRLNHARFAWEVAATGRPILPQHRIVSYYGNPLSAGMGVLGELAPQQMLDRLRQQAAAYAAADPTRPVMPALELVAIVAQEQPGPGGLYRLRMEPGLIEQVAGWAERNGFLLILDVQPGRGSMVEEARSLLPYLKRPYVHLALDPEFAMGPDQRPGQVIGSLDAVSVNQVVELLSELVRVERLPPKVLVVHRFTERMVTNASAIEPRPGVQVVITMDGFGGPAIKRHHYEIFVRDEPVQFGGFKLFYRQDQPLLSPREVVELTPPPVVVIYQ